MKLNSIIKDAPDIDIEQLSTDSRLPMKNAIFFCLNGLKYDGHDYIDEAINNGAKVIIYQDDIKAIGNAIFIKVKDVVKTLSLIASVFYNKPNDNINEYVVGGCYGRSSVSHIINYYLSKQSSCGSVGVFGINYKDKHLSMAYPTLTPLENIKVLDNLKKNNINNCIFETNAKSLFYKKLDVLDPNIFIYTNTSKLSKDFKECNGFYYQYIRNYLYTLEDKTLVLLNRDDESYNELKDCSNSIITYGHNDSCDYVIDNIKLHIDKTEFLIKHNNKEYSISSNLLGIVNVYNITAAIASLHLLGHDINDVINFVSNVPYVSGVMEKIDKEYNIIIDCANELDSIENIFKFARNTCKNNLICVIGINYSDNDNKIEKLVSLCNEYVDRVIYTENESSVSEVISILEKTYKYSSVNNGICIPYRSVALENGINIINKNDTLLVLGKGNENFLMMGLGKEAYDGDLFYLNKFLNKRKEEENGIEQIY